MDKKSPGKKWTWAFLVHNSIWHYITTDFHIILERWAIQWEDKSPVPYNIVTFDDPLKGWN